VNGQDRRAALWDAHVFFICDTGAVDEPAQLAARVADAGIRLVQLRLKRVGDASAYEIAAQVATELRRRGALLVLNDRVDLALAVDADGVHLGTEDLPLSVARRLVGPERLLGASAHDAAEAQQAVQAGADYIGCGSVFATASKVDAVVRGLDAVREVSSAVGVPVFGIGGIDASNAVRVVQAGAAGVAVIRAISAAEDPGAAARQLLDAVRRIKEAQERERARVQADTVSTRSPSRDSR
jgi:thiamine-phosphate diphosphorylase